MNRQPTGVRTLEDLRQRCVIDDETGCWLWRGAFSRDSRYCERKTPKVWIPEFNKPIPAVRAAWYLAGHPLSPATFVWHDKCDRWDCVNPDHARDGTRWQMFDFLASSGRLRGNPKRIAVNAKNRLKMVVPRERVIQAEEMFARGELQKTVCQVLRMSSNTARAIRLGTHPNSSGRDRLIRGASVWTLAVDPRERPVSKAVAGKLSRRDRRELRAKLDNRAAGDGSTLRQISEAFGVSIGYLSKLARGVKPLNLEPA